MLMKYQTSPANLLGIFKLAHLWQYATQYFNPCKYFAIIQLKQFFFCQIILRTKLGIQEKGALHNIINISKDWLNKLYYFPNQSAQAFLSTSIIHIQTSALGTHGCECSGKFRFKNTACIVIPFLIYIPATSVLFIHNLIFIVSQIRKRINTYSPRSHSQINRFTVFF